MTSLHPTPGTRDPEPAPRFRPTDPATSRQAARESERSGRAAEQRTLVLGCVVNHPGLTATEIAERTGLERHAPSRRLPELEQAGLVEKGPPRVRDGATRPEVTWWPAETEGIRHQASGTSSEPLNPDACCLMPSTVPSPPAFPRGLF